MTFAHAVRTTPTLFVSSRIRCQGINGDISATARLLKSNVIGSRFKFHTSSVFRSIIIPIASKTTLSKNAVPFMWKAAGLAGLGLSFSHYVSPIIYAEPPSPGQFSQPAVPPPSTPADASSQPLPPPPSSSVNLYELSFGTVCGLCAGVFIKKGAKALAFLLGGVFVLLQYLGSASIVHVDWNKAAARFENLFYTKDVNGVKKAPTIGSLWNWLVSFLTADFQPRASFLAGLILGLRLG